MTEKKINRLELYFRIRLGFLQLIYKPYLNLLLFLLIFLMEEAWRYKEVLFDLDATPAIWLPIMPYLLPTVFILLTFVFSVAFIYMVGELTARKDEEHLIIAFRQKALTTGHSILINRKRIKGTNITIREFYSFLPMKVWQETKDAIADQLNIHFIKPCIEYGGKNNNHGSRIKLYTAPGRKPIEKIAPLLDVELEKEMLEDEA